MPNGVFDQQIDSTRTTLPYSSVTDRPKRCPVCSLRMWIAWSAQSFLCVALTMISIWIIIWVTRYSRRLEPHEKVHLNAKGRHRGGWTLPVFRYASEGHQPNQIIDSGLVQRPIMVISIGPQAVAEWRGARRS